MMEPIATKLPFSIHTHCVSFILSRAGPMNFRVLQFAIVGATFAFSQPANAECSEAREVWADVKSSQSVAVLQAFQSAHSECAVYSALAQDRLVALGAGPAADTPVAAARSDTEVIADDVSPELDRCLSLSASRGQHASYPAVSYSEFDVKMALQACQVAADPDFDNATRDGATGLARAKTELKEYDEAFDLLRVAVAAGNKVAGQRYGTAFYNGWGVAQDRNKAREVVKALADDGFAPAMSDYGELKVLEAMVDMDQQLFDEAARYMTQAYDAGEPVNPLLPTLITDPKSAHFHPIWAAELMEEMIDQGRIKVMPDLAVLYLDGLGDLAPDVDRGLYYWAKAKEAGLSLKYTEAEYDCMDAAAAPTQFPDWPYRYVSDDELNTATALETCYGALRAGDVLVPEIGAIFARVLAADGQTEYAREVAAQHAAQGSALAMYVLGTLDQDEGSYSSAADWYRQSADAGLGIGMVALGDLYWDGLGVPRSITEGLKLIERAAEETPHIEAQIWLGEYYSYPENDFASDEKALQFLRLATSDDNHPHISRAMTSMGQFYLNRTNLDDVNGALALEWFNRAIEPRFGSDYAGTDSDAYMGLARMYIDGIYVERDARTAVSMLKEAAWAGETSAFMSAGMILEAEGNLIAAAASYEQGCEAGLDLACIRAEHAKDAALYEKLDTFLGAD